MRAGPFDFKTMKFYYRQQTGGEMADTPCAADRSTHTIYINPILYNKLSIFEKKFWLWHEKGHIILNTPDEIKADTFAFHKLAGTEYRSMKQMIEAAENLLDPNCKYHQERIDNLYKLAIEYDMKHPILNKAISTKNIEATSTGINNALETAFAGMIGISRVTGDVAKGSQQTATVGTTLSTTTIIIIAIIAFILLKSN